MEEIEKEIKHTNQIVNLIETESPEQDLIQLKEQIAQLPNLRQKQDFSLAITGSKQSGKTSLKQLLASVSKLETINEIETDTLDISSSALNTDLVLFLVTGDLSDSQWQIIRKLREARQRVLLVFNKQDQYTSEERIYIYKQLEQRVSEVITPEDIVSIATVPNSVKVRQQQKDGSIKEWMEQPEAEIDGLTKSFNHCLNSRKRTNSAR